jgi:hypothetical protein
LGRRADFDPKIDPIVRVQMHRLRQKLKEYYCGEGACDALILEIPKGRYEPIFRRAQLGATGEVLTVEPDKHSTPLNKEHQVLPPLRRNGAVILAVVAAFLGGFLIALFWTKAAVRFTSDDTSDSVRAFWSQFLGNDKAPIIGYPNAVFLLDESNDLFRFRRGATDHRGSLVTPDIIQEFAANPPLATKAGSLYYENGYTGTGELESVAMLCSLFATMHVKPTIKSSRDITMTDFEQHNVILLGSPFQNPAAAQLPVIGDFVFDNPDAHRELWRGRILDLHTLPNEDAVYQTQRDPQTGVLKTDYGLISIREGVTSGFHIAILGGLDTSGTHGVTNFVLSREGVAKLKNAMSSLEAGRLSGFQVLLKIDLQKGYEVLDTQLITTHEIQNPTAGHASSHGASDPSAR